MSSKNDGFASYSSSSFSSSSFSSQLSTPRAFQASPRLSAQDISSNEELRKEIIELETEIFRLERYLLTLYRTSFGDHLSPLLLPDDSSMYLKNAPLKSYTTKFQIERVSSASKTSVSTSFKSLSETEMIKRTEYGHPSLADLLGLNILSPNKLSEEIVRLICVIYSKLSEDKNECRHELGVSIHKLCLDDSNSKSVESMLQNFRSLVQKLEKVDLEKMTREEKLAFWINIHNAMVMNGYIIYGICEDKTSKMILKTAFNIGGKWVNAYDVASSILRIRANHSASRLRTLFSPAKCSKTNSIGHTYALDYTEPLLHFALSTGTSTDPMVRVYTAEEIFQELKQARDGFIRTNVGFEKDTKILLPKVIYNYAKDTCLDMTELLNIISECLTEKKRTTLIRVLKKNQERCIRWINNDSNFGYIIDSDLVRDRVLEFHNDF